MVEDYFLLEDFLAGAMLVLRGVYIYILISLNLTRITVCAIFCIHSMPRNDSKDLQRKLEGEILRRSKRLVK